MDTGLMQPQPNRTTTTSSPLLEQFRAVLSPTGGSPRTLEEKLAALSDTELQLYHADRQVCANGYAVEAGSE